MTDLNILLAFSAGILSFLSPCSLSMMPGYLGYLAGLKVDEENEKGQSSSIVIKAIMFTLGFSVIFILMGLSITAVGKFIITNKLLFNKIAGIIVIFFGIYTMGIFKMSILKSQKKFIKIDWRKRNFGPFLLGIAFGTGWTPCIGPILSSILLYAGNFDSLNKGIILLVFYSLGLAIPFILCAVLINVSNELFINLKKHGKVISIISGILLIVMGILIYTNKLVYLNNLFT